MIISRLFRTKLLVLSLSAAALAADPSGSWKWSVNPPNGDPIEVLLQLELKDGKVTGTYKSPFGESKISNVSFKDDALTFDVNREINGNKFTMKYAGKLSGDAIKGTFEFPGFDGGERSTQPWEAKRAK